MISDSVISIVPSFCANIEKKLYGFVLPFSIKKPKWPKYLLVSI